MDNLIDKVNAYDTKQKEQEEKRQDSLRHDYYDYLFKLYSYNDEALDAIDLANACRQAGIPMMSRLTWHKTFWNAPVSDGFTMADGATHEIGFILRPKDDEIRSIGILGDIDAYITPSSDFTPMVYVHASDDRKLYRVPMETSVNRMRRLYDGIPTFIQEFRKYVESVVEE